jgi:hypothetical protein
MKEKYYFGVSPKNVPTAEDPVLFGCAKEEERRSLKNKFDAGQITAKDYAAQRKALLRKVRLNGKSPKLLTLELKHGDLIVMHGAHLQTYHEVCQI